MFADSALQIKKTEPKNHFSAPSNHLKTLKSGKWLNHFPLSAYNGGNFCFKFDNFCCIISENSINAVRSLLPIDFYGSRTGIFYGIFR